MNDKNTDIDMELEGSADVPCSAWRQTTDSFPPQDVEVEITHPNFIGTRTAIMRAGYGGYFLTDCTHPAMNCYAPLEGSGWRMKPNAKIQPQAGQK